MLPAGTSAQAALALAENMPSLHSTQVLSAVLEPLVQKEPSAQEVASTLVQLAQVVEPSAKKEPSLHTQVCNPVAAGAEMVNPELQAEQSSAPSVSQCVAP